MDKKTIMLVDDEPNLLSALNRSLGRKGFTVLTALNGKDALLLAGKIPPDIIILDISMPGMGGEEVASRLREIPGLKDVPIIFLTGLFSKEQEQRRGNVIGGNIFLAKPVDFDYLLSVINECMTAAAEAK